MYRALYRKWRPGVFGDISGQNHITSTLQNAVMMERLSHAYLFTGSRGTGKTSCAKILAKVVNCLSPVDGNPCNKCEICLGIDSGAVLDVIEIDAASNNGVDNIRDLCEGTSFNPSVAKKRVYIIDEVHMLTAGAFNALLKTLEEPPDYVLFILATTEVHKIPPTIISRCQRFDFRRIPAGDIAERLLFVAMQEKIELEEQAALLIARVADGSLRDALSLLDQCASSADKVTVSYVSEVAGLLGKDYLFELSGAINNSDTSKALHILNMLHNTSCDMERLLSELVNHFRNIIISKTAQNPEALIVCTPEELDKLKDAALGFTYSSLLAISEELCFAGDKLKHSAFQRAYTEALIMRLCTPALQESNSALLRRIADLEREIKFIKGSAKDEEKKENTLPLINGKEATDIIYNPKLNSQEEEIDEKEEQETQELQSVEAVRKEKEQNENENEVKNQSDEDAYSLNNWADVLSEIAQSSKPIHGSLMGSSCEVKGDRAIIKTKNDAFEMLLLQQEYAMAVSDAIYKITGKRLKPTPLGAVTHNTSFGEDPLETFIERVGTADIDLNIKE